MENKDMKNYINYTRKMMRINQQQALIKMGKKDQQFTLIH